MVLSPSFDATTCQTFDKVGLAYSTYPPIQRLITAMQTYGIILADIGSAATIGITTDSDQNWGDPNSNLSNTWIYNLWTHCMTGRDFVVKRVLPTQGLGSGAAK